MFNFLFAPLGVIYGIRAMYKIRSQSNIYGGFIFALLGFVLCFLVTWANVYYLITKVF